MLTQLSWQTIFPNRSEFPPEAFKPADPTEVERRLGKCGCNKLNESQSYRLTYCNTRALHIAAKIPQSVRYEAQPGAAAKCPGNLLARRLLKCIATAARNDSVRRVASPCMATGKFL